MATNAHDRHTESLAAKCIQDFSLTDCGAVHFQFDGGTDIIKLAGDFSTADLQNIITALAYFRTHYDDDNLGQ